MKMGFLFSGIFWGGVLVLLGVSIIIKVVFHIDIPVFRVVVALVLIYLGVRLLFGSPGCHGAGPFRTKCERFSKTAPAGGGLTYKNLFGDERIDLTDIEIKGKDVSVEVETVFGNTVVEVDPRTPTEFEVEAVFGNASVPGSPSLNFGSRTIGSGSLKEGKPRLRIRAKVVFGNLEFIERPPRK